MNERSLWVPLNNADFLVGIRRVIGFLCDDSQFLIYDMIVNRQVLYSPEDRTQFRVINVMNYDRYMKFRKMVDGLDVTAPEYVEFVKLLKQNINIFARILKDLRRWTAYKCFTDIDIGGDEYNIHKFLCAIRREAVVAYNYLLSERVKWKNEYKEKRKVETMTFKNPVEEAQEEPVEIKFLGSADYWKNHETMVHFIREALNYFSRAELLETISRFSGDHEADWETSSEYSDLEWSASSNDC